MQRDGDIHTYTWLGETKMGRDKKEAFPNLLFLPARCSRLSTPQAAFCDSASLRGPGLHPFPLLQNHMVWKYDSPPPSSSSPKSDYQFLQGCSLFASLLSAQNTGVPH